MADPVPNSKSESSVRSSAEGETVEGQTVTVEATVTLNSTGVGPVVETSSEAHVAKTAEGATGIMAFPPR